MSLAIVPGVLLLIVMLFSSSGQGPKTSEPVQAPVVLESFDDTPAIDIENVDIHDHVDYQVIYSFITQRYTRISTGDADLIAKNLVIYGKENKIDPKFGAALMARESAFNRGAISSTGAKGLGQIKDFNFKSLNIDDPYDIQQNTRGTLSYVKSMLNGWKSESKKASLALASYFKGYTAVTRNGKLVDSTTKNYVKDIFATYDRLLQMKGTTSTLLSSPASVAEGQ